MSNVRAISPAEKQRLIRIAISKEWTLLGILWIVLLANVLFDFDIVSFKRDPAGKTRIPLIGLTVVCTIFYAVSTLLRIRRNLALGVRGQVMTGHVTAMDDTSKGNGARVYYRYQIGTREYKARTDMNYADCKNLSVGSPVELLVDPLKPSRSARYAEIYPNGPTL